MLDHEQVQEQEPRLEQILDEDSGSKDGEEPGVV